VKAAIYARCSTTEQHPEAQLGPLRAWVAAHGHEVVEYVDEGESGAKARRPALDAMMAAVRRGEVQIVAVAALDRLGRDVANLLAIAGELKDRGVQLVSLREGIDMHSPMGRAMLALLGIVAQLERDWIRERVAAGLAAAKGRGVRCGRPPKLDADRAARARRMRDAGASMRYVARVLGCSRAAVVHALAAKEA
jgi:DNA invertase Pin-like site-specific DNA recombinase